MAFAQECKPWAGGGCWRHAGQKGASVFALNTLDILKKRADFLRVAQGRRWVTPAFVVQMAVQPSAMALPGWRVGFTVTKKQGNAVVRNRIKRRLREAARQVMPAQACAGHDYVLIGREVARTCAYEQLLRDLQWALRKLHAESGKADE